MKNLLLMVVFLSSFFINLQVNAYDPRFTVNTSGKDVEYKKNKALIWYTGNVDDKKFYFYDASKHSNWLKNRSLKWYEANILGDKYYFVHPKTETLFTKEKGLRWYDNNSEMPSKEPASNI